MKDTTSCTSSCQPAGSISAALTDTNKNEFDTSNSASISFPIWGIALIVIAGVLVIVGITVVGVYLSKRIHLRNQPRDNRYRIGA
jgi:hypothetical protein